MRCNIFVHLESFGSNTAGKYDRYYQYYQGDKANKPSKQTQLQFTKVFIC